MSTLYKKLTCDDVSALYEVLARFEDGVRTSQLGTQKAKGIYLIALMELCDCLGLSFEDDSARHNAITWWPELYQGKYQEEQ